MFTRVPDHPNTRHYISNRTGRRLTVVWQDPQYDGSIFSGNLQVQGYAECPGEYQIEYTSDGGLFILRTNNTRVSRRYKRWTGKNWLSLEAFDKIVLELEEEYFQLQ